MLTPLTYQVGRFCTGSYVELCAASLDADSATSPSDEDGDAPDVSSASASDSSASDASVELAPNATALSALVLEPEGGVSAARGLLVIDNVSRGLGVAGRVLLETAQSLLVHVTAYERRVRRVGSQTGVLGGGIGGWVGALLCGCACSVWPVTNIFALHI